MPRTIAPRRVATLQDRYLRRQGASEAEIRRFRPVLTAQIGAESNFTQGIGSPAGARDIAQFMPDTASSYGVTLGDNRIKDDIRGQVRYMLPLLRKYGVEGALRGYNAGVGAIEQSKGYSETNNYVSKVRGSAGRYRQLVDGQPSGGQPSAGTQTPGVELPGSEGARTLPGGSEGLLPLLQALSQQQAPPASSAGVPAPAFAASPVMPQGAMTPASGGGPAPKANMAQLLAAVSGGGTDISHAPIPGVSVPGQQQQQPQPGGGGGGGLPSRGGRAGLIDAAQHVDALAGRFGAPITARQEQGHTVGGDHDPAVRGATARDIGGGEAERKRIFDRLTRQLGLRKAVYKGPDINVTRNGVRYQIISRDHGTGPHLHVGMRLAR